MRCQCCNCNLSDYESTLKSANTKQYLDTCLTCLREANIVPSNFDEYNEETGEDDES
jgi:hypothetical protein